MSKYKKFIVALIGFAVVAAGTRFNTASWFNPLVSLLTALGVYQLPNSK